MIARRLESTTSVTARSAEDGAAAEVSGRVLMISLLEQSWSHRSCVYYCIFHYITQMIKTSAGLSPRPACACTVVLFHHMHASAPPWQGSKLSGRSGCEMEDGVGSREGERIYQSQLPSSYCTRLLWTILEGLLSRKGSPVSLKKALLVVEGDKGYIQAGLPSVSALSGRRWVQSVSPAASLGFINLCIYFLPMSCADIGTASTRESI